MDISLWKEETGEDRTYDGDATVNVKFAWAGGFAIASGFSCHIDDDGTLLHSSDHLQPNHQSLGIA